MPVWRAGRAYILCNRRYILDNGRHARLVETSLSYGCHKSRRTFMNKLLRAFAMSLATLLMLGMASIPASAHHDDAQGSGVVYEGAGGR